MAESAELHGFDADENLAAPAEPQDDGKSVSELLEQGDLKAARAAALRIIEAAVQEDAPEAGTRAAKAAFLVSRALLESEDAEDTEDWLRRAEALGRQSGTGEGLDIAAYALAMRSDDTPQSLVVIGPELVELGRRSGTPLGLQSAAATAQALGALARDMGDEEEATRYLGDAVELGTRAGTPEGLEVAARCAYDLTRFIDPSAPRRVRRKALANVTRRATRLQTPHGMELAAKASFDLAVHLLEHGQTRRARMVLRLAYHCGTASQTRPGLEQAVRARFRLAELGAGLEPKLFLGSSTREALVQEGYREAMGLARATGTPLALEYGASAANNLGVRLEKTRTEEAAREAYREAVELGSAAETPSGLAHAAQSGANLGRSLARSGQDDEAQAAFAQSIELGKRSGSPEGVASARLLEETLKRERAQAEAAASPRRKGIVVVHGMGEPERNELLTKVVNPVADWLERNVPVAGRFQAPELELQLRDDERSFVTLRHMGQEWTFTEAYWADKVEAPLFNPTVGWAVNRFVFHLASLARNAFRKSLVPAVAGLLEVAARLLQVLLVLPLLVVLFPVTPAFLAGIRGALQRLYVRAVDATPDLEDPEAQAQALDLALRSWHRFAPRLIAGAVATGVAIAGAGLVVLLGDATRWHALGLAYLVAGGYVVSRQFARSQAVDPQMGDTPLPVFRLQGVVPSKHGYRESRLPRLSMRQVYEDGFHNILTAPATAVTASVRRWLRANDEDALLRLLDWDAYGGGTLSRLRLGLTFALLISFQLLNSLFAVALYAVGAFLIFPLMFVAWVLSAFDAVPGIPRTVTFFKEKLDAFLLGSLGDIKVFLDEPIQARNARAELEDAIDALDDRCDEILVLAHSLGSAVSYETLVQAENQERVRKVTGLLTIGGILPMIWRIASRRPAFDRPLPDHVRWLNLWSRYDPADPGPIEASRLRKAKPNVDPSESDPGGMLSVQPLGDPEPGGYAEKIISNEDDLLRDHTSYLDNPHEVTPAIVREIWGEGAAEATGQFQQAEGLRALRRKHQILALSGPRLVAWYALPVVFFVLLSQLDAAPGLLSFVPRTTAEIARVVEAWQLDALSAWPVFSSFMTEPSSAGDCVAIALTGGILCLVLAQLLYGFLRSVLWNGFFRDASIFSPTVPPPPPTERVALMGDGGIGEIIAIAGGQRFRA